MVVPVCRDFRELVRLWCFTRTLCPTDAWLFLRGVSVHEPSDIEQWEVSIDAHKSYTRRVWGAPVSPHAPLSWGVGSGFSIIFQGSTTSISQTWHPAATVTEWQDATFECHVLYITKPLSSWGCHQASTSTGALALPFGVCLHGEGAHHRYFSFCTYVYVCALSVSSMGFV